MKWLRQQRKVESIETAARINRVHLSVLRQRLANRVRSRLQEPGTLAWAFAAGSLAGTFSASRTPAAAQETCDPSQQSGAAGKAEAAVPVMRYLNGLIIAWNLLSNLKHEQHPET